MAYVKYQNRQIYHECLLVSLWNAAKYFGIRVPYIGTNEYIKRCKKCKCIDSGCVSIKSELNRLKMYAVEGEWDLSWIRNNLPVEVGIDCRGSYHSVLIIKVHGYRVKLLNYALGRSHWMLWSDLKKRKIEDFDDSLDGPLSFKLAN